MEVGVAEARELARTNAGYIVSCLEAIVSALKRSLFMNSETCFDTRPDDELRQHVLKVGNWQIRLDSWPAVQRVIKIARV